MAESGLSFEQLSTAFRHRNFKPLYFLYGEEAFLMDELQALLLEHALAPHERDFNCDLMHGPDADAATVLGICNSFPMMAERRVVVVRNFDRLKDNRRFAEYAERPNPQAVVLLLCPVKPNLSAHPYRALKAKAAWAEFKPLYDNQVPGWIQQRVEARGGRIEPQAVQMLADFVGANLHRADTEIEKLFVFAGGRLHLTADDVLRASGQTRDFNVFELQRAIGQARRYDAISITERLLQQASNARGEALLIVSVLTTYFLKLWKLTASQAQRLPDKAVAARIGVSPYFLSEYVHSLRHFDRHRIEQAFRALLAADFELKGGAERDERLILLLLLLRLLPEPS